MDLSLIILSYKSKEHLKVLLPSIWASQRIRFGKADEAPGLDAPSLKASDQNFGGDGRAYTAEVIVVDNGSSDGTFQWLEEQEKNFKYEGLRIIKNSNTGFASGNNVGIKKANGRYVLLLNPDTKLEALTLAIMLDFMESRSDVGMSGCKLIKPDGSLDLACRRRFPNPWNSFKRLYLKNNTHYNYSDLDENKEMEVDSIVGAFMLVRRQVIDRIGLLDESFFMYGEDLDWCWRCKEAGFKVWYFPKTAAIHYKGQSSRKEPFRMLKAFHDAMWIFYQKHYASKYPFLFNWAVFLGIYFRLALLVLANYFKKNRTVSK